MKSEMTKMIRKTHFKKKNYTPHIIGAYSSMNNIYQNTKTKTSQTKKQNWTIPLLLESPKSKIFQSPDLEKDFLIDSGAESNINNIRTWNEIQNLHQKLFPSKTSSI